MPSKVTIPNTFATATTAIPLSQLDANFSNVNAAINNALTFSNYALDAGTANTYSVSITGQITTYAAGLAIQFLALNTNTGASTLNVNAQGAKTIVNTSGAALTAGAITAGAIVSVMYDGTNFQLLNDAGTQSETFLNLTVTGTTNTANLIVTQTGATFAAGSNTAPAITTTGDTNTGIFFPAADTIAFTEGGAEAMRIDSSGQLLLNTTSALTNVYFEASNITPTTQFITNQTASYSGGLALINYSAGGFGSVLTIGSSRSDTKGTNTTTSNGTPVAQLNFVGNDGTNFRTTAAIKVAIDGVSGSGDMPGRLEFYTTADGAATATERMRIDSSGNVGIGTSSPSQKLHVVGQMLGVRNALYNDTATYGFSFQNATTTTMQLWGGYDSSVGGFIQATNSGIAHTNLLLNPNGGNVGIGLTPTSRNNTRLQIVDGIGFPATQVASSDANTLDDYEEGTWTPTIVGSTSAGTASYSTQIGRYTKIGRMVQFECYIAYSGGNGTGNLRVAGLPFTAAGSTFPPISCITENIAWTASYYACPYVQNGDTYIVMAQNPTGGGARNAIAYDAAGEIQLAGTYSV